MTSPAATVPDLGLICECGHPVTMHNTSGWMGFSEPGVCYGQVDTRPPSVGGSELHPCKCKRFVRLGSVKP